MSARDARAHREAAHRTLGIACGRRNVADGDRRIDVGVGLEGDGDVVGIQCAGGVDPLKLPCTVGYMGPGRTGQRIHDGGTLSAVRISRGRVHLRHLQADGLLPAVVK